MSRVWVTLKPPSYLLLLPLLLTLSSSDPPNDGLELASAGPSVIASLHNQPRLKALAYRSRLGYENG